MIYYLEHTLDNIIYHWAPDPFAAFVPLINIVTLKNADGTEVPTAPPVGIDKAAFDLLESDRKNPYRYDPAAGTISKVETDGK